MAEWWSQVGFVVGVLLAVPVGFVIVDFTRRYEKTPVLFHSVTLGGCLLYGLLVAAVSHLPLLFMGIG